MDPQQRLLMETTWDALEDAGVPRERVAGASCGVFVGAASSDFRETLSAEVYRTDRANPYVSTGLAGSVLANRLSYFLDAHGPSVAVDTACSSSLVAIHLACQSLRLGESDLAVAAGVNVLLSPGAFVVFSQLQALSPDGRCKAFDASADGYGRGEGCGVVILKRLADAQRDGDRIWAVVRGSAVNQDGRSSGLTVPSGVAQERLLRRAQKDAGVAPEAISYVEAHGTGTILGDPIEAHALAEVFAEGRSPDAPCIVGSVKTNLGHLEAAAGVAGVIKTALAIHHRAIPKSLHFTTPNPHIPFERLPLRVQTELGPWPEPEKPLVAGVSAFGIGGTNAHVILGEPARGSQPSFEGGALLLTVSAQSPAALSERVAAFAERLREVAPPSAQSACQASVLRAHLAPPSAQSVCRASVLRRSHLDHRLAIAAEDAPSLRARLDVYLRAGRAEGVHRGCRGASRSPVVFVFSGQGAQWAGMAQDLAGTQPVFARALERCDAVFAARAGFSIREELARPASSSRLAETAVAQPALVALAVALVALWRSWGVTPDAVLGHSRGEIAAAHVTAPSRSRR